MGTQKFTVKCSWEIVKTSGLNWNLNITKCQSFLTKYLLKQMDYNVTFYQKQSGGPKIEIR